MLFSNVAAREVGEAWLTVEAQLNACVMHREIEICHACIVLTCEFDYGTSGVAVGIWKSARCESIKQSTYFRYFTYKI